MTSPSTPHAFRPPMLGSRFVAWLLSSMLRAPGQPAGPVDRDDGIEEDDGDCRRSLRDVLDNQIIPRLTQAHRSGEAMNREDETSRVPAQDIPDFAWACTSGDRASAVRIIERLRSEGVDSDGLMVDLIAPSARHLGRQWEDDEVSFSDVTIGLVLMHELVHSMGYEYQSGPQASSAVRRVMLASAPGSQHVLGLSIVSEIFRKSGWQVVVEVSPSAAELCRAVRNEWFDLIGLSVGVDEQLRTLPELVANLKTASRNPATPVMLGGPIFTIRELQPQHLGAQAICLDARESVRLAQTLIGD